MSYRHLNVTRKQRKCLIFMNFDDFQAKPLILVKIKHFRCFRVTFKETAHICFAGNYQNLRIPIEESNRNIASGASVRDKSGGSQQ